MFVRTSRLFAKPEDTETSLDCQAHGVDTGPFMTLAFLPTHLDMDHPHVLVYTVDVFID